MRGFPRQIVFRARRRDSDSHVPAPARLRNCDAACSASGGEQCLQDRPPVAILEPDDVVQFGRRDFEDVAVVDRGHAVDGLRRDVHRFARLHLALDQLVAFLDLEQHPAGPEEDRLVLLIVVLQAEGVAGVDVNQLADVAVGLGPVQLVAPGLLYTIHGCLVSLQSAAWCSPHRLPLRRRGNRRAPARLPPASWPAARGRPCGARRRR